MCKFVRVSLLKLLQACPLLTTWMHTWKRAAIESVAHDGVAPIRIYVRRVLTVLVKVVVVV